MLMLLSESKRYLNYFEKASGLELNRVCEKTPYGDISLAKNDKIIFIENLGLVPFGIPYLIEKYSVKCLGMVSKVGGINPLLNVGDILVIDDYIDNTTCRPKSYIEKTRSNIKIRYDMTKPFCQNWKKKVLEDLYKSEYYKKVNIFNNGTYICTDGPGFESSAEIDFFWNNHADVVGHWISPFVYYARELNVCFLSIGVVSNVYYKDSCDMLNSEENNKLFGKLYKTLLDNCQEDCNCQKSHIIEYEEYD
ncbi:hypothetical protein [Treponema bryantii]|uniref:phosphorylase family protein n=1 Tax=Treponema bryantii TaxID=163 RepID=UPI002B2DE750|nr:putative 6-oxopurine nucleoside phosphorylase [Treponema bryantii]